MDKMKREVQFVRNSFELCMFVRTAVTYRSDDLTYGSVGHLTIMLLQQGMQTTGFVRFISLYVPLQGVG